MCQENVNKYKTLFISIGIGFGCSLFVLGMLYLITFIYGDNFYNKYMHYIWNQVFTIGILSSLFAQVCISIYFIREDYYKELKNSANLNIFNYVFCFILVVISMASLLTMQYFKIHIFFSVLYLFFIVLMDIIMVKAKPIDPSNQLAIKFNKCCKQLLYHVDGVAFVILVLWIIYLEASCGSNTDFCFYADMKQTINSWIYNLKFPIKGTNELAVPYEQIVKKHDLSKPIMSGVIGFHMFLTMILVFTHLRDWLFGSAPTVSQKESANP